MIDMNHMLVVVFFSGAASVCFAILFNLPPRALPIVAFIGASGQLVKNLIALTGAPAEAATFTGALVVGLLAEIAARLFKMPAPLFSVPSFIPLVPGVPAYRAVVSFAQADYLKGLESLVSATLLTAAIAAGLGTAKAFARLRQKPLF